MSVDEDTVKTGSPQSSTASSLQMSDCTGSYSNISVMVEGSAATPDLAAACPGPGATASPKHVESMNVRQRTGVMNENIHRRNSFHHHSKQQQQTKVTKRRNTSGSGFKHPMFGKRRRRANSESDSVLPTNFLLGGNIFDPLNLNSLLDEDVNKALNAETPKSSPLPAKSRDPVEILIPRDITDPLNLNSGIADGSFLVSHYKSGGRKRHRNRHHGGGGGGGGGGIATTQINLSESGKSEVKAGASTPPSGTLASCSLDISKESDSFSSGAGDSHDQSEMAPASTEDSALNALGAVTQHTSRRKRRRNSGKAEAPLTHSTPVGKSGPGERNCGSSVGAIPRNSHVAGSGSTGTRSGLGGRQQQQKKKKKFQYGNYNKYYGYRNPGASEDSRLRLFRPEWFEGKDVLDLGCNSGHMTLYIAKMLRPSRILGLDIDSDLVHVARKNIRHYLSELQTEQARRASQEKERNGEKKHNDENGKPAGGGVSPAKAVDAAANDDSSHAGESPACDHAVSRSFPVSLRLSRGPIAAPPLAETASSRPGEFPANVSFVKANYVLDNDNLLLTQRPEYDVILCLSVTKWVQLNWGDSGLKRLFKRVYRHLRPGGMFILEPQPWESYVRRRKLTDNISRNYNSISLKPDQFPWYLTHEVGFTSFEHLGAPKCPIRGFQRPIYLFHK